MKKSIFMSQREINKSKELKKIKDQNMFFSLLL